MNGYNNNHVSKYHAEPCLNSRSFHIVRLCHLDLTGQANQYCMDISLSWCGILKDGFNMGRREDLTGGGLRRSAGGWEGVLKLRRTEEYWRGDEYWLAAILK